MVQKMVAWSRALGKVIYSALLDCAWGSTVSLITLIHNDGGGRNTRRFGEIGDFAAPSSCVPGAGGLGEDTSTGLFLLCLFCGVL